MSSAAQIKEYIATLANTHPNDELRQQYAQMRELYEKKLWHQLTVKVEQLVKNRYFDNNNELVQLYNGFIKDFEKKMNQLTLSKILLSISRQIREPNENIAFLQKALEKISPANEKEAYSLMLTQIAAQKLNSNQLDESKTDLDKVGTILDSMTGADNQVYSNYYKMLALYYKGKVSSTEFYRNSLMYLLYTPVEKISPEDQQGLAFDMGIAALISKDIHNFGELLAQPVLKSLDGTQREWLKHFLVAFNAGDIARYEHFLVSNRADFENQPALKANINLLREKISILALMELVFARPSEGRTLTFQEIATTTKISLDDVELLVMKAFSVKLMKGLIDEVNKSVSIYWVQPRVLDVQQIGKMKERLNTWIDSVGQLTTYMQNETASELLT